MKKFKTLIACLILLTSCMIFASCSKGDEKVEFGETSPVVLEVGETYSPNISVSPEKYASDLTLSTSDSRVVVVSPDKKLVAVGVGTAQIEAKVKDATANLVVEVVEKKTQLQAPIDFRYEAQTNRIVWAEVNNATSYDVEIDGEIVAENLTTNFYEINSNQTKSVRIKANGIGKYLDSDFTSVYKFKNLPSPTNLVFNKTTQTLSWSHEGDAKFRVCINNILLDAQNTNSCVLPLENAGDYDVFVVAVADANQKDGDTFVFDSLRSDSLKITRFGAVDKNTIVWNASESLLTWGEIKGAKYRVQIGSQTPVEAQTNNLTIQNLEKGNYEIKITAISDQPLVLDAKDAATSNVAITKQLQTPVIESFDEDTNTLTLTDFGEAQNFQILCNGVEIYSGDAVISDSKAKLTLPSRVFAEAGEYVLTAISKEDEARFYTQSATSMSYVITRLAAPTNLRIENGRTFAFGTLPQATFGYVVFVAGAEHTLSEATYDLFDISPNTYEVKVKYLGNKNNILESANASITITKLLTPVLEFDKETQTLSINNLPDGQEFDISINSSVQKNVTLSQNKEYSLSGMLAVGENRVTVQALAKQNEVLSDIAEIDIYQLEEIQNLMHESINDVSYIKLLTNDKFDNFVVSLGDQTLDHTTSYDSDTTILTLTKKTSEIFAEAGDYALTVEAISTDANTINPASVDLEITKLPTPENFTFTFPNKFTWDKFVDIDNNFNLIITKGDDVVEGFDKKIEDQSEYVAVGLPLATLTAKLKVLGNGTSVLDSKFVLLGFDHKQLSTPTNVNYENDQLAWDEVENANKYMIFVGAETYSSETNSFETKALGVGQYSVQIKATNTSDPTISSEASTQYSFIITRKLAAPTNLTFDKSTLTLSWDAVTTDENGTSASATKYQVNVLKNNSLISSNYTNANQAFYEFYNSTFSEVGEYVLTVQACGNETDDYIEMSETSEQFKLTKLAAPTQINITTDEVVWCAYDINTTQSVELLINDTDTNSLATFDGEIKIKAKFIGKTDNYLDSDYGEFERTRLLPINNLRIENDKVMWDENSYVEGYLFSLQYGEETIPYEETIEKDVTEREFEFERVGSYTLTMTALGNKTVYLDSRTTSIQISKLACPTDLSLVEIWGIVEGEEKSRIKLTFECEATDILGYEIFVDGQSIGTCAEKEKQIESSVFSAVGQHTVYVVAIGDNSKNAISSAQSQSFSTQRLAAPSSFGVGSNYYVVWNAVHSQTEYRVIVKHDDAIIKSVTTASTYISFEDMVRETGIEDVDGEIKEREGTINISVFSCGNNSTLLRSLTTTLAVPKTPKTELSYDADKVYFTSVDSSSYFEVTILLNGDTTNPIIENEYWYGTEREIPTYWASGEYTFIVRQVNGGEFVSGYTTAVIKKLNTVDSTTCKILRSEENEDVLYLTWGEVADASGYVVKYSNSLDSTDAIELYRGTNNSFALPDTIKKGQVFFWIQALGSAEKGFSSNFIFYNVTKLSKEGLKVRNENGVLSWDLVGTAICSGYKIVINGDDANAIKLNSTTSSCKLKGVPGKLNIKIKALGNFETSFGIDSDYDVTFDSNYEGINIDKLPAPTNVRVVEGEIVCDFDYTLDAGVADGKEVGFVINVDGKQFDLTDEGIANLKAQLLSNKEYSLTIQARHDNCLTSDESEAIVIKILENPNSYDGSTNISTNDDKTESYFNWTSATGAGQYQVKIEGGTLSEPKLKDETGVSMQIPTLEAGSYTICVRRIGETGAIDGVNYLSSGFSSPISFTVLSAPVVEVENGQIVWMSQNGAYNYYLYVGEAHTDCGNVTSWTFLNEYKDFTKETEITFSLQAIGDGVQYIASTKTSEITVVKPRPPQMLVVKDGALSWENEGEYTYYKDTENKQIYLEFLKNNEVFESFEIDVENVGKWPLDSNYLQKLTTNLPTGEYTLKIKQIGDNTKVITSEYSEQKLNIVVAPSPANVRIEHDSESGHDLLRWETVSLEGYGDEDVTYVVYAFDKDQNDWIWIAETNATFVDIDNENGLLKTSYNALAVATKGNTTAEGCINYVTGNMADKVNILVLGSTSNLRTVDGNLTWDIVASAVKYQVTSEKNSMLFEGDVQSSYLDKFDAGVHEISIRALGSDGEPKDGVYIINGVKGESSTFTKLETPSDVTTTTKDDNTTEWGSFRWKEVNFANGYNVYVASSLYCHTDSYVYESDYEDTLKVIYQFQAKGNDATPSKDNPAYISSNLTNGFERTRLEKIEGVEVQEGRLRWTQGNTSLSPQHYFVEFYQNGERVKRVKILKTTEDLKDGKVEFDVEGYIKEGTYLVRVRQTCNDGKTYIAGLASDGVEITKLSAPSEVRLENGVLKWKQVDGASGYVIRLKESGTESIKDYTEGFSLDEQTGTYSWRSDNTSTTNYYVSIRAISQDTNKLNSSWATKNGALEGGEGSTWLVHQIPQLSLNNFEIKGENLVWDIREGEANIPTSRAYQVWLEGEEAFVSDLQTNNYYEITSGLNGLQVSVVPYGENTDDYFASVFSEIKHITKPDAPTGLKFDEDSQTFTWDKIDGEDVRYIVYYKIDNGDEQTVTLENNKFEPSIPGAYVVQVAMKRTGTSESLMSDISAEVEGTFDLFTSGSGKQNDPFEITDAEKFANMAKRPNAYFKLTRDITLEAWSPLKGFDGKLDGNGKTITLTFKDFSVDQSAMVDFGLFETLGENAQIENLNVSVGDEGELKLKSSSKMYVGIIAGDVAGATITNCTVSGTITIVRSDDGLETVIGSVAGLLSGKGKIISCTSILNIIGDVYYISKIGGIVGQVNEGTMVSSCTNKGSITGINNETTTGANNSGGIAAYNAGTIESCTNEGQITTNALAGVVDSIAGGIVAVNNEGTVTGCTNTGVITASNTDENAGDRASYAGGIVGWTQNGLIDGNYGMEKAEIAETNYSTTKVAGAVVGHFEAYSGSSKNYYLTGLSNNESHESCTLTPVNADKTPISST